MSRVVVCRPAWTPDDGREDGAALQAVRAALGGDGQPADGDPDLAPLPQTDRGPQLQLRLRPHRLRQLRKEVGPSTLCFTPLILMGGSFLFHHHQFFLKN